MSEVHDAVSDAVGGDLHHVFEEGYSPTDQGRNEPDLVVQTFEMAVPGEGHEDIRDDQQEGGLNKDGHKCSKLSQDENRRGWCTAVSYTRYNYKKTFSTVRGAAPGGGFALYH